MKANIFVEGFSSLKSFSNEKVKIFSLNIFREAADFVSLSKAFQSFAPRKKTPFGHRCFSVTISVSDERRNYSLLFSRFMNNFL